MTHFEYDLAVRAVIGLAGCAVALVALAFDWLDARRPAYWTVNATGKPGWRVGETETVTTHKVG